MVTVWLAETTQRLLARIIGDARAERIVGRTYAVLYLVYFQVSIQYARALLGILWFAISPALFLAVYVPVLSYIYKAQIPGLTGRYDYPLFIVAGFLPWGAFSDGLMQGAYSLVSHPNVVKHAPTPPSLLPVLKVATAFAGLAISLGIYIVVLACLGRFPGIRLLLLPLSYGLLFTFTLGCVFLIASVGVFLQDLLQFLPTLLLIGFFASPVGYVVSTVGGTMGMLLRLNPMVSFLGLFRAALAPTASFAWQDLEVATAWSVGSFIVGFAIFRRLQDGFSDAL